VWILSSLRAQGSRCSCRYRAVVRKGGVKDKRFTIRFAVTVDGRLADFGLDEGFEFGQLAVAPMCDRPGFFRADTEAVCDRYGLP